MENVMDTPQPASAPKGRRNAADGAWKTLALVINLGAAVVAVATLAMIAVPYGLGSASLYYGVNKNTTANAEVIRRMYESEVTYQDCSDTRGYDWYVRHAAAKKEVFGELGIEYEPAELPTPEEFQARQVASGCADTTEEKQQ
jgi:hypothetical protein